MKVLIGIFMVFVSIIALAEDKAPLDVQALMDRPDIRPQVEKIKSTLNIGSDEDLAAIVKSVNPEIIKKVADLNIQLTDKQIKELEKLAMDNKGALVATLITGNIPKNLLKKAEEIVPELKKLEEKDKEEVFKAAGKTANKLVFEKMVKAELVAGINITDTGPNAVAQLNAQLLNIRKITLGGIEIEDVHIKVTAGYPQNGLQLINGKVKVKDSDFSFEGSVLGITHDMQNKVLEFNIAKARINYNILPWLQGYGGINLGVRSYTDGTVFAADPVLGLRAHGKLGPVKAEGYVEGSYRIAENNAVLSCGGNVGLDVVNSDVFKMQAGIMSRLTVESNPRENGNKYENFNGVGISGHF